MNRRNLFIQFIMQRMSNFFFCLVMLACLVFASCQQNNGAQTLDEREALLDEREQALLAKEDDYRSLVKMRDSLLNVQQDTGQIANVAAAANWTDSLLGNWDSRLLCTSTSCKSYVIGDQRTEQWQFLKDSTGFYLAVEGKSSGTKRYDCELTANVGELRLVSAERDVMAAQNLLTFSSIGSTTIRGQQRTTGHDNCKLIFSVQLTPNKK